MSSILRYLIIGTAMLALSLSAACKDDASPAAEEVSAGAEAGAQAGVEEGVETGMEGGAKEGAKEGATEGGEAAANEVVN
jgi:flagellar biosynthesis/type III secretory pathway protein FliH